MIELLFSKHGSLADFFRKRKAKVKKEIEEYGEDYMLKVSETDLQEHLFDKYSLEPPIILDDSIHQVEPKDAEYRLDSPSGTTYMTKGTVFTVVVPFGGDTRLLHYQPHRYTLNRPQGEVYPDRVELIFRFQRPNKRRLERLYKDQLASIREYLEWVTTDVERYNDSLQNVVKSAITQRKKKLLENRAMSQALGLPILRRENAPRTYTVPEIRRKPKVSRPKITTEKPFVPEPELEDEEYEAILDIMRNMTQVMERSPNAFATMGEDDIRHHFLVQLNGQYKGQATGETFNFQGKTDILIKFQERNVFIAECKFWQGPKRLTETIDQLLGYLSWRDTKTAILLFNRNRDFTRILKKIPNTVHSHSCFKRSVELDEETDFRYILHQVGDPNREIILTILAFDIPRLDLAQ
jgi:hypothetical protein